MKTLSFLSMLACSIFFMSACSSNLQNAKTQSLKVYGNCDMCKSTIEKAGSIKNLSEVSWNEDTKMASITFDSTKTNANDVLKKIALAGYDNELFLAPTEAYQKLDDCCQYNRDKKANIQESAFKQQDMENKHQHNDHIKLTSANNDKHSTSEENKNELGKVFDQYFLLKNALVQSDSKNATASSKKLSELINSVNMGALSTNEHDVWMKVLSQLKASSMAISKTNSIDEQRNQFIKLSSNMYEVAKTTKLEGEVYYQNCPMFNDNKGANWLSKDKSIKNPYYGSQMLSCGKTVETLK